MLGKYSIFLVLFLSFTAPAFGQGSEVPYQLTVSGRSSLKKPADEGVIRLGVMTEEVNANEALKMNSEKMDALITALKGAGLKDGEYQTGQFVLYALYTNRPVHAPEDWTPRIRGYHVENKLILRTQQLNSIGTWVDTAVQNGANVVDDISFGLHDPRIHRDEAIREAAAYARSDAAVLSSSTGITLGKVLAVSLDQASYQPVNRRPELFTMAKAAPMMDSSVSPPIVGGDVDVQANVTIVYEIK
ncbi:MAG: SIMPL domain-containing protein [Parachlamydiales bacterium]|jgi:hypothetical protein